MKKEKFYKKIIYIFIFFILVVLNSKSVLAKIPVDQFEINMGKVNEFQNIGNSILGFVQVVGTFAAVAALMIIGIKYMLGSAEEKAEKKQNLFYYIIGAILVLGIVNIVPLIYDIVKEVL